MGNRILGVDPGLNITGYGVIEIIDGGIALVEAGVVRGKPKASLAHRVHDIHEGIADVIQSLKPSEMAVEELYSHYERPKTAILMGHARGVICLAATAAGIPVKHYAATRIKKMLTGNGRAPKSQMQETIQRNSISPSYRRQPMWRMRWPLLCVIFIFVTRWPTLRFRIIRRRCARHK